MNFYEISDMSQRFSRQSYVLMILLNCVTYGRDIIKWKTLEESNTKTTCNKIIQQWQLTIFWYSPSFKCMTRFKCELFCKCSSCLSAGGLGFSQPNKSDLTVDRKWVRCYLKFLEIYIIHLLGSSASKTQILIMLALQWFSYPGD